MSREDYEGLGRAVSRAGSNEILYIISAGKFTEQEKGVEKKYTHTHSFVISKGKNGISGLFN